MPLYLKFLRWLTAISIIILLSLLVQLCVSIYTRDEAQTNPAEAVFTRENVAAGLAPFGTALAVSAVLVVTAGILQKRYDLQEKPCAMTAENRLRLAKARAGDVAGEALTEERRRMWINLAAVVLAAVCMAPGAVHMLDGDNFVSWDMESVMGGVMLRLLPGIAAVICIMCLRSYLCDRSMLREAEYLRKCPQTEESKPDAKKQVPINYVRILLYAVAAALIISGVLNGGLRDVLVKAINICTECIGLG